MKVTGEGSAKGMMPLVSAEFGSRECKTLRCTMLVIVLRQGSATPTHEYLVSSLPAARSRSRVLALLCRLLEINSRGGVGVCCLSALVR